MLFSTEYSVNFYIRCLRLTQDILSSFIIFQIERFTFVDYQAYNSQFYFIQNTLTFNLKYDELIRK